MAFCKSGEFTVAEVRNLFCNFVLFHYALNITEQGNYVHPRSFQRSFDMLLKQAGLPKIRLHDMRHSTASLLLTNGTDLRSVSDILGHANTRVTTDIYLHSTMENKRQALKVLDGLLSKKS